MRPLHAIALTALVLTALLTSGCEDRINDSPELTLSFSDDTLRFDTVFTEQGSATRIAMVYNRNKEAIRIESVSMGQNSSFKINLDGETAIDNMKDIVIRGGDSMYMFVKVYINPQNSASPVLVEDSVLFKVNGRIQRMRLEAFGQDVILMHKDTLYGNTTWGGDKPYLVLDTTYAVGDVTIKEGTTFYMHDDAVIVFLGSLKIEGTLNKPVTIRGDRLDNILRDIPYDYASGKWGGLFLLPPETAIKNPTYDINYLDVHSGTLGLFCQSSRTFLLPTLKLNNSRIHNCSTYGLVVQNMNAEVVNTEISNCAGYCVYLSGGKHTFVHNTIANYFNYLKESVSIHSVRREDVTTVYISDLSKNQVRTEANFSNNVISGWRKQNVMIATSLPERYDGTFLCNFLRNDTLSTTLFPHNYYEQETDTVFLRTYMSREDKTYYDFRLDSVSPARDIADSLTAAKYPLDRNGNNRLADGKPDAGCYEWQSQTEE